MVSRRQLLAGVLGGTVIAVGGGSLYAFTRTPHDARRPWDAPGEGTDDPRVAALEWAVLAPNPHNRQPWLADLSEPDTVTLFCDLDRRLPQTDPFDRQITIGLGCFTELFALAAGAEGLRAEVTPFPDGAPDETRRLDQRPVARIRLSPGGTVDPLFAAAPLRRSNKEPFNDTPLPAATLNSLLPSVRSTRALGFSDPADVSAFSDLGFRAHTIEMNTPRTLRESAELMRFTKAEVNEKPDGIDIGGTMMTDTLHHLGLLTEDTIVDPQSTAFAQGLAMYKALFDTAKGWLVLVSDGNDRVAQLGAGRDWLRLNLAATAAGVAVHPFSQALQEFEEMAPLFREVHEMVGADAPQRVQMLARAGYADPVPPSPRWPAASRIV